MGRRGAAAAATAAAAVLLAGPLSGVHASVAETLSAAGCRVRGMVVKCDGAATVAAALRAAAPELPRCLELETGAALPAECSSRVYDVAEVAAVGYRKLPRFLDRLAVQGGAGPFDMAKRHSQACALPDGMAPPVIVGGIGDSGTRGVAQLLSDGLGYQMCPGPSKEGCNKAGDNTIMFKFSGREVLDSSRGRIPSAVDEVSPLQRAATLAAMCVAINETATRAQASRASSRWGWKSPRSLYYGAFYKQLLGDNFRLVHVLRDGRDVATGDNQMQYMSLCSGLNTSDGKAKKCASVAKDSASHYRDAIQFWAQMNREVFEFGGSVLGRRQYFLLRIEDFVIGDDPGGLVDRLARFLGLPKDDPPADARSAAAQLGRPHAKSYGGHKLADDERKAVVASLSGAGTDALRFFGYKADDWGIERRPPA